MNRYTKLALSAIVPVALLAGCSGWLTGPKLTANPNFPTSASRDQLLVGVETGQTILQTGALARLFSMWTQQMGGTDRQYIAYSLYQYDEDAFSGSWSQAYTGGGLIDERAIESNALSVGDSIYAGVGKVMEALTMGTVADIWGDVPYTYAVSDSLTPPLDPQQQVYQHVQAVLDTAIDWLNCTAGTCQGPVNGSDIIYDGNVQDWIELAHTLKARFYLHVEPRMGMAAYDSALAQADSGISDPSHDFDSYQSADPNEWNLWYQFMVVQRSGYISAGQYLVNLLNSTSDPRLAEYFAKNSSGQYLGAPPGGGSGDYSTLSGIRLDPGFHQPMVTFAENQLIKAEAELELGQPGAALADYNAERTSQGVPTSAGPITLNDIMTEKYIALFQEIEPWNDYKRTCLPALAPATGTAGIPRRLLYPLSAERNENPNIPPPGQQPASNWNDPTGTCP